MLNDQRAPASTSHVTEQDHGHREDEYIREIHALIPPHHHLPQIITTNNNNINLDPRIREVHWETQSHRSLSLSMEATAGTSSGENFTTMSREFNALVLAGSNIDDQNNNSSSSIIISPTMMNEHDNNEGGNNNVNNNLGRIGEDDEDSLMEETNPLAIIVPENNPNPADTAAVGGGSLRRGGGMAMDGVSVTIREQSEVSVQRVKKEEVEAKIAAWQNAKLAKIKNRFKREDTVINGMENEQVQKAIFFMKKVERKLEEKRARAVEKMENEVAKAHRKAEERKASAEAKRGTKMARVVELANLMRAVGRPPNKRLFLL